jgi:hypothetical protein
VGTSDGESWNISLQAAGHPGVCLGPDERRCKSTSNEIGSPGNYPYSVPRTDGLHIYTDGSLMDTNENAGADNHCNLLSYLTFRQHATHSNGELETINIALMQISCRIWTFIKAVILSAAIQATV